MAFSLEFQKFFSTLEQFFLTVGQNNFGNKIPFFSLSLWQIPWIEPTHPRLKILGMSFFGRHYHDIILRCWHDAFLQVEKESRKNALHTDHLKALWSWSCQNLLLFHMFGTCFDRDENIFFWEKKWVITEGKEWYFVTIIVLTYCEKKLF